jgi:hypothetical protein
MQKTSPKQAQKLSQPKWVSLIALVLTVVACTQSTDSAGEKKAAANQGESKKSIALPDGFPTDSPVFPNAKLVDTTLLTSSKSYALTYSLEKSKGTTKDVIDFYTAELIKQGWKIPEPPILNDTTGNYILSAKKDGKEFRVTTYPLPDQNNDVSINLNLAGYSK